MQPRTRRPILALASISLLWSSTAGLAQSWLGEAAVGIQVRGGRGPLAEARVEILYRGPGGESGGPAPRATNEQGQASFTGLAEGVWSLEVSHPDYLSFIANLSLRGGRKTEVVSSFLEASGTGRNPMRVRLFQPGTRLLGTPLAVAAVPSTDPRIGSETAVPPDREVEDTPASEPSPEVATPTAESLSRPIEEPEEPAAPTPAELPEPTPEPEPVEAPTPPEALATTPPVPVETSVAGSEPVAPKPPEPRPPLSAGPSPSPSTAAPSLDEAPPDEPEVEPLADSVTEAPPRTAVEPPPETETPVPPPSAPAPVQPASGEKIRVDSPADEAPPPEPPSVAPVPDEPSGAEPAEQQLVPEEPAAADPPAAPTVPPQPPDLESTAPEPPGGVTPTPTPAAPAVVAPLPAPAPEAEPPSAPGPAAAPEPLPPLAGADASARSFRDRTCFECKPGEWAVGASAEVPAGDGCGSGALDRAAEGIGILAARIGPALGRYGGNALAPAVFERLDADARAAVGARLDPLLAPASPCRVLALALPAGARMSGFRYEAFEDGNGGDCLGDQPCPVGDSRWLASPGIERGSGATLLWAVFENRSSSNARLARFIGYFAPPSGWRP